MKFKKIMLVTLMLLAILTIGAASASDDVASDNLTANDDSDVIEVSEYDPEDYSIEVDEDEICIDEDDEDNYQEDYEVAYIELPTDMDKGSLQVFNNGTQIFSSNIDLENEDYWYIDEDDDCLYGSVYVEDILDKINDGDVLTFKFFEIDDDDNLNIVESFTKVCEVKLTETTLQLSVIDDEDDEDDEDVEVMYGDLEDVSMTGDWKTATLIDFKVRKNITSGTISIFISDDEDASPVFEKSITNIIPTEDEDDDDFNHYFVTIGDLNIEEPGEYYLYVYFMDGENTIWDYTEDELETLILTDEQIAENENAIIKVPSSANIVHPLITIETEDNESNVIIYVDDDVTPLEIPLKELVYDGEEYFIYSKALNGLGVGKHKLNVTCMGANLIATVNITSNMEIAFPDNEEIIYNGFDDGFVFFGLKDGEITEKDIEGKVNITIIDDAGNVVDSFVMDIDKVPNSEDVNEDARVIKTNNLKNELNGKYTVVVIYEGDEGKAQAKDNVTFKTFATEDYGASIKDTIDDENDYAITFTDIPLNLEMIVEIDGNPVDVSEFIDEDLGVYYISYNRLVEQLTEGSHSVRVYLINYLSEIDLASGNVIVDLKENYDLALNISVADIQEGNVANVVVTTNSSFTGNISVQIGSFNYTVSVANGQGSIQVPNLPVNTYTATATFNSDGIFNDATKTATFKVTAKPAAPAAPAKKVIKLTLNKVKVKKSAKKLVLKATLKINGKAPKKGTKVIFTFKGKKYTGKTNAKGVAKVTIKKKVLKKLKVGKKVKYTAKYSTKTVKRTVKVKK